MAREHVIDPDRVHHNWDSRLPPTLRIESGDVVSFELAMAGRGQVEEGASYAETTFDWDTLYNLLGPIWIDGAEPNDTVEVEVLSLESGDWGWTAVLTELGLLPDDFPSPIVRTSPHDEVFLTTMLPEPGELEELLRLETRVRAKIRAAGVYGMEVEFIEGMEIEFAVLCRAARGRRARPDRARRRVPVVGCLPWRGIARARATGC